MRKFPSCIPSSLLRFFWSLCGDFVAAGFTPAILVFEFGVWCAAENKSNSKTKANSKAKAGARKGRRYIGDGSAAAVEEGDWVASVRFFQLGFAGLDGADRGVGGGDALR
jgi:hypothetical protein